MNVDLLHKLFFNKLKKKFEVCIRIDGNSHRKCGISSLIDTVKIRDGFINSLEKK